MGILFTITMGFLFTIVLGIQLTISSRPIGTPNMLPGVSPCWAVWGLCSAVIFFYRYPFAGKLVYVNPTHIPTLSKIPQTRGRTSFTWACDSFSKA